MPKTKKKKREAIVSGDTSYTTSQEVEEELDELEMTDELVDSLLDFLKRWHIRIECFAGGWNSFEVPDDSRYNTILTSETVYDLDNLPHLKELLRRAAKPTQDQLTLVACKRIYFGVGGGEIAFKHEIGDDGEVENVWASSTGGVERTVMRVRWPQTITQ
jgi:protein-histidine N-methyltransferase